MRPQPQSPRFLDITSQQAQWEDHVNDNFDRAESHLKNPLPIAAYASVAELPDPTLYQGCLALAGVTLMVSDGTRWWIALDRRPEQVNIAWRTSGGPSIDFDETGACRVDAGDLFIPAGTWILNGRANYRSTTGLNTDFSGRILDVANQIVLAYGSPTHIEGSDMIASIWLSGSAVLAAETQIEVQILKNVGLTLASPIAAWSADDEEPYIFLNLMRVQ